MVTVAGETPSDVGVAPVDAAGVIAAPRVGRPGRRAIGAAPSRTGRPGRRGCSAGSASSTRPRSTTTAPTAATRPSPARSRSVRRRVIAEVTASKLIGRGGAAFPTGRKWAAVATQPAQPHYLVCNADESEPGTFKDRVLLEGDPFATVEAMTIAAFATGAIAGLPLHPRRVPRGRGARRERDRSAPARPASSGRTSSARASPSTSSCAAAPAPTSAARRRRSSSRSRASAASRATSRRSRSRSGCSASRRSSTTSRRWPTCPLIVAERRRGVRPDRHRGLDRAEALLPVGPRRPAGRLRGRVRGDAARPHRAGRRRARRPGDPDDPARRRGRASSSGPRRSTCR